MVVEREAIGEEQLRDAVFDWLDRGGWVELLREHGDDPEAEIEEIIDEHVDVIAEICRSFPVGSVIERRGTLVALRSHRVAA